VHRLGASSAKHFVEVNNPNGLTRTTLLCEVKYMTACRVRDFYVFIPHVLEYLTFTCKYFINVVSVCFLVYECIMNLP